MSSHDRKRSSAGKVRSAASKSQHVSADTVQRFDEAATGVLREPAAPVDPILQYLEVLGKAQKNRKSLAQLGLEDVFDDQVRYIKLAAKSLKKNPSLADHMKPGMAGILDLAERIKIDAAREEISASIKHEVAEVMGHKRLKQSTALVRRAGGSNVDSD